ncbi:MAG: efflux RND transporter permease subunit [Chitinophagaceae bacterium]
MNFGPIPLEAVADIKLSDGPPMINSENAMLRGTVLFNVRERDLGSTVKEAQQKLNTDDNQIAQRIFLGMERTMGKPDKSKQDIKDRYCQLFSSSSLWCCILLIILLKRQLVTMITVPFALIGGVFMVYFYGINLSVAVAVGFIALFGMAIETAMLMTIYLNEAMQNMVAKHGNSKATLYTEQSSGNL